ncbi:hypothetical protein JTB14_006357 [Gonioctena quinquepunctata]|nr:hypothetical protein JTB14_006357 [Gonioctena quinquepunctata]
MEEDITGDHTIGIARDKPEGKMHAPPFKNRGRGVPPRVVTGKLFLSNETVKRLREKTTEKFTLEHKAKSTIVFTQTADDYNNVQTVIKNAEYQYHTYTQPEAKTHDFILEGFESAPEPEEVKEASAQEYNIPVS